MVRLDSDKEHPRRYVGDMTTRLLHRTDSEDPACTADADHILVYGDDLAWMLGQEWSTFVKEVGPLREDETPEEIGATVRLRAREVMRNYVPCPICKPGEGEDEPPAA